MRFVRSGNLVYLVAVVLLFTIQSFADSHARIVRLSDVEGSVQVDRNTGQGFEKALLNLPMTQGVKLRTNDDARAEVEFEDGTTMRLGSDTTVHFDELSLADSGVKNSVIVVEAGVVYVNYTGNADNNFSLKFARQTTRLTEPTHLRLEMDSKEAALADFSGPVHVQSDVPANNTSATLEDIFVKKNQTAEFDLQKQGEYQLVKDIAPDVFDDWDRSQEKYHDRYAKAA
ncbi:MAG TPA: FecR domain-containing protein, partial [Terriglobales bacterium]